MDLSPFNYFHLAEVFCAKFDRHVKNDHTISCQGRLYKILEDPHRASYAKAVVQVRVHPDYSMNVFYQGRQLNVRPIANAGAKQGVT